LAPTNPTRQTFELAAVDAPVPRVTTAPGASVKFADGDEKEIAPVVVVPAAVYPLNVPQMLTVVPVVCADTRPGRANCGTTADAIASAGKSNATHRRKIVLRVIDSLRIPLL
jgi:hypothetical protein